MQEYTFTVTIAGGITESYEVRVDDNAPLGENFQALYRLTVEHGDPLPIYHEDKATGTKIKIIWSFSWGADDDQSAEPLVQRLSLREQGVIPGAVIYAHEKEIVGASNG